MITPPKQPDSSSCRSPLSATPMKGFAYPHCSRRDGTSPNLQTARPPVSLKKIHYEGFKGRVLFNTHYNEYFKKNVHMFNAIDFLAELTQHIPPKGVQLIRRYGLYSSRTKGAWLSMPHVSERAPPAGKAGTKSILGILSLVTSVLTRMRTFQMTLLMHALTGKHGPDCCQRFTR